MVRIENYDSSEKSIIFVPSNPTKIFRGWPVALGVLSIFLLLLLCILWQRNRKEEVLIVKSANDVDEESEKYSISPNSSNEILPSPEQGLLIYMDTPDISKPDDNEDFKDSCEDMPFDKDNVEKNTISAMDLSEIISHAESNPDIMLEITDGNDCGLPDISVVDAKNIDTEPTLKEEDDTSDKRDSFLGDTSLQTVEEKHEERGNDLETDEVLMAKESNSHDGKVLIDIDDDDHKSLKSEFTENMDAPGTVQVKAKSLLSSYMLETSFESEL